MTQPTSEDLNAPPGGGPNAQPIIPPQPVAPPADPPAPPVAPIQLEPEAPESNPSAALEDLGDPGLNVAAEYFVNTLGLSLDSPEIVEAAAGNYSYLEATIAKLGDKAKGAAPFVQLAKDSLARVATNQKAKAEATTKAVYEAVGGEENWKAVSNYARSNMPAEKLAEANAALSQGGLVAEATAKYLLALASQSPAATVTGTPTSDASAPAATLQPHTPLNREQYRAEYRKLVAEYGITGASKRPELAQLNARLVS